MLKAIHQTKLDSILMQTYLRMQMMIYNPAIKCFESEQVKDSDWHKRVA